MTSIEINLRSISINFFSFWTLKKSVEQTWFQLQSIYVQLLFLSNLKDIYMAIQSKWTSFTQRKVDKDVFCFFVTPNIFVHNRVNRVPSNQLYIYILLRIWVTHGVPPWNIVWLLFSNKGLIRHFIIWGTLHFKDLPCIWLSKVNGPALPKERWIKVNKALPEKNGSEKKICHNRGPPPPFTGYSIIFENILTIEAHDTNRYTTLYVSICIS